MKRILIVLAGLTIVFENYAQDVIYKNDGTEIQSIVSEITPDAIKYKNFSQPDGPIRNLLIKDVFMIIYKNGTKEVFKGKYEEANKLSDIQNSTNSNLQVENKLKDASTTNEIPGDNTFVDSRDGNVYKTVKIGKQTWMAENIGFKVDRGSILYGNDRSLYVPFGLLYNYDTAKDICPDGWHLPDQKEWEELVLFYGGARKANIALKPTLGWPRPKEKFRLSTLNGGTTWEITFPKYDGGFGAFPGGQIVNKSEGLGFFGTWWIVSEGKRAKHLYIDSGKDSDVGISDESMIISASNTFTKEYRSVRCIKND